VIVTPVIVTPVRPVDKHHLLVFHADWCTACQRVKPVVNQLEAAGVIVERINYDEHPDIARKYNITSLPTFILNPGTPHEVRSNDIEVIQAELN
jgi:thiol-disulfide isomerase/thioredoxin